ncbi:MAG: hypothetical protein HKO59_09775 [Phycisphaerales bacterium]|nr:hypothetical protein [Phycisphaerales bacterium]
MRNLTIAAVGLLLAAAITAFAGPDAVTGNIASVMRWTTTADETAYSFANTMCNIGDEDLAIVVLPSTAHPFKGQNLFRLSAGRFEQIGQAWLLHDFCALHMPLPGCGTCPGAGGCLPFLLPECSDSHSAAISGAQALLTPKWEVNAFSGDFVVPPDQGEGVPTTLHRRLRVRIDDLDPAGHPDARFFAEVQQIAADDAAAGNSENNASFREVSLAPGTLDLTVTGAIEIGRPAIAAWADADPTVTLVEARVPREGLLWLASRVADLGDGRWSYEYAIQNLNSDRAVGAIRIPVAPGVTVTDVGFHDVDYHSGEAWDSTDWDATVTPDAVAWATTPYDLDPFANALRWGTLYNVRFVADAPPAPALARLELFKPGTPAFVEAPVMAPVASTCPADLDESGDVGFTDLLALLAAWGPCGGCVADLDGSGDVGFADLLTLLAAWGVCAG